MMRRWIIRVLFLMLPLFCAAGYWREWSVGYGNGRQVCWVGFSQGRVALAWGAWELAHSGLNWNQEPYLMGDMHFIYLWMVLDYWPGGWHWLGFQYMSKERPCVLEDYSPQPRFGVAVVPLWWILVVVMFVLLSVWWKTRPKGGPKTGFPVEVTL